MQRQIGEQCLGLCAAAQEMTFIHLPIHPRVRVRAVKKHFRASGRFGSHGGARAADFFHFIYIAVAGGGFQNPVGEGIGPAIAYIGEEDGRSFAFAFHFRLWG